MSLGRKYYTNICTSLSKYVFFPLLNKSLDFSSYYKPDRKQLNIDYNILYSFNILIVTSNNTKIFELSINNLIISF